MKPSDAAPEPVRRLLEYAGKKRSDVVNPGITAREAIEIANWMQAELQRRAAHASVPAQLVDAYYKAEAERFYNWLNNLPGYLLHESVVCDYAGVCNFKQAIASQLKKQFADKAAAYGREQSQWVSVEDQLPEDTQPVLVFADLGNDCDPVMSVACRSFSAHGWHIFDAGACPENSEDITHWMPLPEPPTC